MRTKPIARAAPHWSQLIADAVATPGVLSSAYQQFWNYSVGNQLLAIFECMRRGIPPGPIHTFNGWLELGRHVKKGEKAITLCMPVTVKRKRRQKETGRVTPSAQEPLAAEHDSDGEKQDAPTMTVFTYKPRWFVLSQTEGDPYVPTELPAWSESRALRMFDIERIEFVHSDGNCQGYAHLRQIAVSPIAALPHKTLFHEVAHIVLGHTTEGMLDDHERTPVSLREVEAECVALICCESLGLSGAAECRGYIQHWLGTQSIPERNAQRILRTAGAIMRAGYPGEIEIPAK